MEINPGMFSSKIIIYFFNWKKKVMNILDDMGWVNYQELFILEVNKAFKCKIQIPEGADILRVSDLLCVRYWSAGTVVSASWSLGDGRVTLGNLAQRSKVRRTGDVKGRFVCKSPAASLATNTSVHREHNSWPGNMSASRPALSYINLAFRVRDKSCHADQHYHRNPSRFHIDGDWTVGIRERQREW